MWYRKIILASAEQTLRSFNVPEDTINYILSLEDANPELANFYIKNIIGGYKRTKKHISLNDLQAIPTPRSNEWTEGEKRWVNSFIKHDIFYQWALVQMRKQRIKQRPDGEWEYRIAPALLNQILSQIYDWWKNHIPHPQISSFTLEQAKQYSDEWHRMMIGEGEGKMYEPINTANIVYGPIWSNPEWEGYTIQAVTSENDLKCEGGQMNHCVGGYGDIVQSGEVRIFSLRNPENKPLATIEIDGHENYINQIKGVNNSTLTGDIRAMVGEWVRTLNIVNPVDDFINKDFYTSDGSNYNWNAILDSDEDNDKNVLLSDKVNNIKYKLNTIVSDANAPEDYNSYGLEEHNIIPQEIYNNNFNPDKVYKLIGRKINELDKTSEQDGIYYESLDIGEILLTEALHKDIAMLDAMYARLLQDKNRTYDYAENHKKFVVWMGHKSNVGILLNSARNDLKKMFSKIPINKNTTTSSAYKMLIQNYPTNPYLGMSIMILDGSSNNTLQNLRQEWELAVSNCFDVRGNIITKNNGTYSQLMGDK